MANDDLNCSKLFSQPGIQRDGTRYDSDYFIDGQGTRFYKGRARKIGGETGINYGNSTIVRNMFNFANDTVIDNYLGRYNSLTHFTFLPSNLPPIASVVELNRTPTDLPSGFSVDNVNNSWKFALYETAPSVTYPNAQIIAHWCPNAGDINNQQNGYMYYGDIKNNNILTPIHAGDDDETKIEVNGGVIFVAPFLIGLNYNATNGSTNGSIVWNNPSAADPLNFWLANEETSINELQQATIANTKIVAGAPVIGAQVPTALIWSLNQLIRITSVTGGAADAPTFEWSNNPVDDITIMAANSIVRYQQTFFWIGTDNFYMYDGVVRSIPNTMNRNWFFDNVNKAYSNKIFGVLISAFDEIWWFYPRGDSTECNAVIIYNIKEQWWADTFSHRSAAVQSNSLFPYPIMADSQPTTIFSRTGPQQIYPIWQHEIGTDRVLGDLVYPIQAYYAHHYIDICSQQGGQNNLLRNRRFEPDFKLSGDMTIEITNLMFANDLNNGKAIIDGPYTFNDKTQYIDFSSQGRLTSLRFESNTIGGNFQSGKSLYDWNVGDKQQ
jgi:hypothetical protein